MWVYLRSEPNLYTVGFYKPDGEWTPAEDFDQREQAADRVHYLNGGDHPVTPPLSEQELNDVLRNCDTQARNIKANRRPR